jgi:hypothetical protein
MTKDMRLPPFSVKTRAMPALEVMESSRRVDRSSPTVVLNEIEK